MKKRFQVILFITLFLLAGRTSIAQVPSKISAADKVYGLSRFWQEVNYNFVYLDKVNRKEWDSLYRNLITKVQETNNDYEYYRELQKFCAFLKDGHTNVYFPPGIEQMNTMFGDYRFFIENIDHKPIIVRTNYSKREEIPVGSEIIAVNGMPAKEYREKNVAAYISSSTDYVLEDWSTARILSGLEGESYTVKIRRPDNKELTLQLTHKRTTEEAVYPAFEPNRSLLEMKWLKPGLAYVSLNSFGDPKIDTLFIEKLPELYKAKALIIDLRYNGGGSTNIGTAILEYLTNDKVLFGSRSISREHIPSYKAWGKFTNPVDTANDNWSRRSYLSYLDQYYHYFEFQGDSVKNNAPKLVVPTAILIGHNTASAAEDFLIYADNQKHMTKIGAHTFGSTGQPYLFDLPGGGSARVCTKKDVYPDGREFVGYGIKPDIAVSPTLQDYLLKKDPVLDKAVEFLEKKLK